VSLLDLSLTDVRCIRHAELTLDPEFNLIWGRNGSGKTSLLEGIFLLGRGRSFRTRNSERLIHRGQDSLVVFGRVSGAFPTPIGVEVSRGQGTRARVGQIAVSSLTDLTQAFPVQIIDPGVHKLLEEGAHRRRRWLDWAVFHVEPQFAEWWARYRRALKQRNAALRSDAEALAWDPELARLGELIDQAREQVVARLQPHWRRVIGLLAGFDVELRYNRGWPRDASLRQCLKESHPRDVARGTTLLGAHRADIALRMDSRLARDVLSRGQQKLVAIAMVLCQLELLQAEQELAVTLLLDDPSAELDEPHLQRFIHELQGLHCQLIVTSLQPGHALFGTPRRVFHVEQGAVRTV